MTTVSTQILQRRSNFRPEIFGAVAFKFEPNMTAVIQYILDNYSVHEISLARA